VRPTPNYQHKNTAPQTGLTFRPHLPAAVACRETFVFARQDLARQ
jgi:hypothetical protein